MSIFSNFESGIDVFDSGMFAKSRKRRRRLKPIKGKSFVQL